MFLTPKRQCGRQALLNPWVRGRVGGSLALGGTIELSPTWLKTSFLPAGLLPGAWDTGSLSPRPGLATRANRLQVSPAPLF